MGATVSKWTPWNIEVPCNSSTHKTLFVSNRSDDYTLTVPDQILLGIEDLDLVYDLVKQESANWFSIGLKLGFQAGELTEIQSMPLLIVQGTAGYLRELLTRWLKRKNPPPYLQVLAQAIYNAGNERLGSKLVEKYTKQKKGISWNVLTLISGKFSTPGFERGRGPGS